MDKIEVGEYVRTNNGIIGTLIKISEAGKGIRYGGEFITDTIISIYTKPHTEVRLKERDIVKHSKNKIGIVEVDDFVNGYIVTEVYEKMVFCLDGEVEYWADEIENIVTKEQFESIKYTFEEEENGKY